MSRQTQNVVAPLAAGVVRTNARRPARCSRGAGHGWSPLCPDVNRGPAWRSWRYVAAAQNALAQLVHDGGAGGCPKAIA